MSFYTHQQIEELLGAFVLDALEDDERDLVEAHLVGCPRCRNEVSTHRETVVLLANTGADAPEGVWARIAESLDETPPELDMARILPFDPALRERPSAGDRRAVTVRAAAAMVAVAAGVFAFVGVRIGEDDDGIGGGSTRFESAAALANAFAAAASDPNSEKVSLETADGAEGAQVVRLRDGTGFVAAHTLTALPSDRTYQLWGLRGETPISLGVLGNDPEAASFKMVGALDGFAITNEVAAGVGTPTAKPVAVGLFDDGIEPARS